MKTMTVAAAGRGRPPVRRACRSRRASAAASPTPSRSTRRWCDGKTINLIQISLLVVVITSLLLRSLAGGLLVLLPLATAALVNLGLMGWTGILLSMGTAAISAMAVGIGADYAVYFIFRVREEFQRTGDLREATATALTTSGKAIAYVASAVAGGYLCLTLSVLQGARPPRRAGGADHGDQQRRDRGLPAGGDPALDPALLEAPISSKSAAAI